MQSRGIYHAIVDEGAEVGPLLAVFQQKAEQGGSRQLISYVSNLIVAWSSRYQSEPEQSPTRSEPQ
jgi:LuxR family transcriptional regulator, maltose regulon positive regulatory protein